LPADTLDHIASLTLLETLQLEYAFLTPAGYSPQPPAEGDEPDHEFVPASQLLLRLPALAPCARLQTLQLKPHDNVAEAVPLHEVLQSLPAKDRLQEVSMPFGLHSRAPFCALYACLQHVDIGHMHGHTSAS
jgi:hypothetical protein